MKALLISGVILIIASLGMPAPDNGPVPLVEWMYQSGFVLLLGALVIYFGSKQSTNKNLYIQIPVMVGLGLMLWLFILGFYNGEWWAHPLGAIISFVGFIWVYHRLSMGGYPQLKVLSNTFIDILLCKKDSEIKFIPLAYHFVALCTSAVVVFCALFIFHSVWIPVLFGLITCLYAERRLIKDRGASWAVIVTAVYGIFFFFLMLSIAYIVGSCNHGYCLALPQTTLRFFRELLRY